MKHLLLLAGAACSTLWVSGQTPDGDSLTSPAWSIELPSAAITVAGPWGASRQLASSLSASDQLVALPAVRLAALGEGLVQPVLRGLQGSRVAVLERGMPMQGGRWGSDHGLVLPWHSLLSQTIQPATGLNRLMAGGALAVEGVPWLPATDSTSVEAATRLRHGDGLGAIEARWTHRRGPSQTAIELGLRTFADRNVPDSGFTYLDRTLPIVGGRLENTSGRSVNFAASWRHATAHQWELGASGGRFEQGLFPGFIGFPLEADLVGDAAPRATELPRQIADRLALTAQTWRADGTHVNVGLQWNERSELAPPHAHGWGPLPSDDLSFRLREVGAFAAVERPVRDGVTWGLQAEGLVGETAGWEFLLPSHRRGRVAALVGWDLPVWQVAGRIDLWGHVSEGFVEPLYAISGEAVGVDERAVELTRGFVGVTGEATRPGWRVALTTRAPDPYELAANGIHHGTARFERGAPELRAEHELLVEWGRGAWRVWAAAAPDFIYLGPTASFAPIAHAGQVMAFEQAPVFRTGAEFAQTWGEAWYADVRAAVLGAWRLDDGMGLPFTPPADARMEVGRAVRGMRIWSAVQTQSPSFILARNESHTPGFALLDAGFSAPFSRGHLRLTARNLLNTSYLQHINPYRALGLAEQGRTIEIAIQIQ